MVKSFCKATLFGVVMYAAFFCFANAAQAATTDAEFRHAFGAQDFKLNQDAVKIEAPENGKYKITSRVPSTKIFTTFQIPDGSRDYLVWNATAKVADSNAASVGVVLWGDGDGHAFYIAPNGDAVMEYTEGTKKISWQAKAKLTNFAVPADITIRRDKAGNVVGEVNGVTVVAHITNLDVAAKSAGKVTAVSFFTMSSRQGGWALYESLAVNASGKKDTASLFD